VIREFFSNWSKNRAILARLADLEGTLDTQTASLRTLKRDLVGVEDDVTGVMLSMSKLRGRVTGAARKAPTDTDDDEADNGQQELAHIHPKVREAYGRWQAQRQQVRAPRSAHQSSEI